MSRNELGQFVKVDKIKIVCKQCGKIKYLLPSEVKKQKQRKKNGASFCNAKCAKQYYWDHHKIGKQISICEYCKKEFKHNRWQKQECCSVKCASCLKQIRNPAPSGEKSHNWKGGRTPKIKRLKTSQQYKEWRKSVFKRDNNTCQECGAKNFFINAHHIIPVSEDESKIFDLDNGQTLCIVCHQKKHPNLHLHLYQSYLNYINSKNKE